MDNNNGARLGFPHFGSGLFLGYLDVKSEFKQMERSFNYNIQENNKWKENQMVCSHVEQQTSQLCNHFYVWMDVRMNAPAEHNNNKY